MAQCIKLVQGDTRPDIIVALTDPRTWVPVDVSESGTTVMMLFRAERSDTILSTITASKLTGKLLSDGNVDTSVSTPGLGGRVMFSWPVGVLDVEPGYYEGEIKINFADGTTQTVYDQLRFSVRESA